MPEAALQVNPGVMARTSQGFNTTLPRVRPGQLAAAAATAAAANNGSSDITSTQHYSGLGDLSLRRHQVSPPVFRRPTASSPESVRALNLSPWVTSYDRAHLHTSNSTISPLAQSSPSASPLVHRDHPSGASRNNVQTNLWPKRSVDTIEAQARNARAGEALVLNEVDPTVLNEDGRRGQLSTPMGEAVDGYPHTSSYSTNFRHPDQFTLAGPGTEGAGVVPRYVRGDFKVATHAVPPPFCTDQLARSDETHSRISVGSGYALNNSFAYEQSSLMRSPSSGQQQQQQQRPVAQSQYKASFLPGPEPSVPVLGDGSVQRPMGQQNGYLRNGDLLAHVHAANEGGEPANGRSYETTYNATHQSSEDGVQLPVRAIARPGTVAADGRANGGARRRIEPSAFSRSEAGAPAEGLGSQHMKLRLAQGPEAGLHHLYTRPHTSAGYAAAPPYYHDAHSWRVAPAGGAAMRTGSGIEESQRMAELRKLRKSSPSEYAHELVDAPRYMSTYQLLHGDKRRELEETEAGLTAVPYSQTARGGRATHAGWGATRSVQMAPSVETGGVRNPYETSYERASQDAMQRAHWQRAQGKSVANTQGTGYTENSKGTELIAHKDHTSPAEHYSLTSHLAHNHPDAHARDLPPAVGSQVNTSAPIQSAYSREHTADAPVFPAATYTPVQTLDGRTVTVRARDTDLHPTVQRALAVKEPPPIKNHGAGQMSEAERNYGAFKSSGQFSSSPTHTNSLSSNPF